MLRVRASWTAPSGGPYLSTFYFTGSNQTEASNCGLAVANFLGALDGSLSSSVAWQLDTTVASLSPMSGEISAAFAVASASGVGAGSTDVLPRPVQLLYRWTTGAYVNGRQVRGRMFVPGVLEGSNVDGTVPAATQTAFMAFATAFLADANSEPVVWHRPNPATGALGSQHPITGAAVWNQWAILRKRRD